MREAHAFSIWTMGHQSLQHSNIAKETKHIYNTLHVFDLDKLQGRLVPSRTNHAPKLAN